MEKEPSLQFPKDISKTIQRNADDIRLLNAGFMNHDEETVWRTITTHLKKDFYTTSPS